MITESVLRSQFRFSGNNRFGLQFNAPAYEQAKVIIDGLLEEKCVKKVDSYAHCDVYELTKKGLEWLNEE